MKGKRPVHVTRAPNSHSYTMVHCFVEESVVNRLGLRTSRNVVTLRLAYLAVSANNYNLSVSSVKSREKIIMKVNCQSHYFQFKLCLFFL